MNESETLEDDRMDLLLREVVAGAEPPDLVEKILARHRAGREAEVEGSREPRSKWWLVAAVVLLGAGITWTVSHLADRSGAEPDPVHVPAQYRGESAPVRVESARDIEKLAPDTVRVHGVGLRSDDLRLLTRLRGLKHLELSGASNVEIRGEDLAELARFTKLEVLVLDTHWAIGGAFDALQGLPALRHLDIHGTRVDALSMAVIAQLTSLTHLDVANIRGFSDDHMRHVLKLRGLRQLNLTGNALIGERMLLRLGILDQLRHLELSGIRGEKAFRPPGTTMTVISKTGDGVGVDDRVLKRLGEILTQLRYLDVSGCSHVTAKGIQEILKLPHLESLDLTHTDLSDVDLQPLLLRGRWRMLGLPLSATWSRARPLQVLEHLPTKSPGLRELRLNGVHNFPANLSEVCKLTELRVFSLAGSAVDEKTLARFADLENLEVLRVETWPEIVMHLPQMKRLREVHLVDMLPDSGDYLRRLERVDSVKLVKIFGGKFKPGELRRLGERFEVVVIE